MSEWSTRELSPIPGLYMVTQQYSNGAVLPIAGISLDSKHTGSREWPGLGIREVSGFLSRQNGGSKV